MKKHKIGKKKLIIIIVILLIIIASGVAFLVLNNKDPKESLNEEKTKEEVPVKKVQIVNLESNSRNYAVMINNNSAVWPYQSGLNDAYLVYELLVEGGITREMALFKDSDAKRIASVRSSRHYFLDYALENDAIYVHWGWSPQAQSDISTLKINNINGLTYENKYFYRDNTVKAATEHRGYTSMELLTSATDKLKYRNTSDKGVLLNYSAESLDLTSKEGYADAYGVEARFSNGYKVKFAYDENTKLYTRYQNDKKMIDYTSKEDVKCKNIIIYKAKYSGIAGDDKGRQNMNNIGSGEGIFISEGQKIDITWEKSSRESKTVYKTKDGKELVVNDGITYIEIIPTDREYTIIGKPTSKVTEE